MGRSANSRRFPPGPNAQQNNMGNRNDLANVERDAGDMGEEES